MKKIVLLLTFIVIGGLIITHCDDSEENEESVDITEPNLVNCVLKSPGKYHLALVQPYVVLGEDVLTSALVATTAINQAGGINGATIGIISCDSEGDAAIGQQLVNEIVANESVAAIIGPGFSSVAMGTYDIAAAAKVPMIATTASSPALTNVVDDGYFFRTFLSDAITSKVAASLAVNRGYTRVFSIHPDDDYGNGAANVFKDNFSGVFESHAYDHSVTGFADITVDALVAFNPDAIFFVDHVVSDAEAIIKAAQNAGVAVPWMFVNQSGAISTIGTYLEGTEGVKPKPLENTPAYNAFSDGIIAALGADGLSQASKEGYDAVFLAAIAMALSGDPLNGELVKNALAQNTMTGDIVYPFDWAGVVNLAATAGTMNYDGASGPVDFDANGDVTTVFRTWSYQNGSFSQQGECWDVNGQIISCE